MQNKPVKDRMIRREQTHTRATTAKILSQDFCQVCGWKKRICQCNSLSSGERAKGEGEKGRQK